MKMSVSIYRRIVRGSALYDLVVIWPFAIPGIADRNLHMLSDLHHYLGWGGTFPVFEPLHILFANLLGVLVIVWSLLRLLSPETRFGLIDGATRIAFSCLFLYYLLVWQASAVLYLFLVPEVLWAAAQLVCYRRRFDRIL